MDHYSMKTKQFKIKLTYLAKFWPKNQIILAVRTFKLISLFGQEILCLHFVYKAI